MRLHQHLPPTPPSHRTTSPCSPSLTLHPITNTALDHLFLVLEALLACNPPRCLQFFMVFLTAGCFPISLCNSKHALSETLLRVFYLLICLLKACSSFKLMLMQVLKIVCGKKAGASLCQGVYSVKVQEQMKPLCISKNQD